jgi:ribonuclease HI
VNQVQIYTDGACKGNPGPGGWGVLLRSGAVEKELFGGELGTTNNRMETDGSDRGALCAQAPLRGAAAMSTASTCARASPSGCHGWKAKGWRTASRQPVKNVDLWQRLDALVHGGGHQIDWRWVRGHNGDAGNERADQLANMGVQNALWL